MILIMIARSRDCSSWGMMYIYDNNDEDEDGENELCGNEGKYHYLYHSKADYRL